MSAWSELGVGAAGGAIYFELYDVLDRYENFSTIFYYAPGGGHCGGAQWLAGYAASRGSARLLWSSAFALQLNRLVNAHLLVVACLPTVYRLELLQILANCLRYMRQARLFIELAGSEAEQSLASQVLEFCFRQDMLNAVLVFGNFQRTRLVYSYQAYPSFALRSQHFELSDLFPDKMSNLQGYQLRTQPDLSEPNSIFYRDAAGQPRILGYVWNMLEEYAKKHNAQLTLAAELVPGKALTQAQMLDLAQQRHVDVAASIQPMSLRLLERYHNYAYPVSCSSWCTMLPLEPLLSVSQILSKVLPLPTFLCLVLLYLIYALLPLLLGRLRLRHWLRSRFYVIGWLLLTVLLALNYQSRLLTNFMSPPIAAPIDSFAALYHSKYRIFGLRSEFNSYDFAMRTRYSDMFRLTDQNMQLIELRNSLDTSFAYTVTHSKWQLYAQQQLYSSRPLFRYSKNMCYYQMAPFALVIPDNSPHRALLDRHMMQLMDSGLFQHWLTRSFYYMVQAGRLKIRNLSPMPDWQPLGVEQLVGLLLSYGLGLVISVALFIAELIIHKWNSLVVPAEFNLGW